jgi:hypothetical protein
MAANVREGETGSAIIPSEPIAPNFIYTEGTSLMQIHSALQNFSLFAYSF